MKTEISELKDRWTAFGERISTQVRTVAFGMLATSWGLLIGKSETANNIVKVIKVELLFIGIYSIIILLLDYLHCFSGFMNINNLLVDLDTGKETDTDYRYDRWHDMGKFLFWVKQFFTIACALWLLFCLSYYT